MKGKQSFFMASWSLLQFLPPCSCPDFHQGWTKTASWNKPFLPLFAAVFYYNSRNLSSVSAHNMLSLVCSTVEHTKVIWDRLYPDSTAKIELTARTLQLSLDKGCGAKYYVQGSCEALSVNPGT